MRFAICCGTLFAASLLFTQVSQPADQATLPIAAANDNRSSAGVLKNGILELKLELRASRWYPEDENGAHVDAYAFAEVGAAPQIPGPLIRVPQNATIHLTIRNTLRETSKIAGLNTHPANTPGALSLAPGEYARNSRPIILCASAGLPRIEVSAHDDDLAREFAAGNLSDDVRHLHIRANSVCSRSSTLFAV